MNGVSFEELSELVQKQQDFIQDLQNKTKRFALAVKDENKVLRANLESIKAERDQLFVEREKLSKEKTELLNHLFPKSSSAQLVQELESTKLELKKTTELSEKYQLEIKNLVEENSILTQRYDRLHSAAKGLTDRYTTLQRQVVEQNQSIDSYMQTQKESYESKLRKSEEEISKLKSIISKLKKEKSSNVKEYSDDNGSSSLHFENQNLKRKVSELEVEGKIYHKEKELLQQTTHEKKDLIQREIEDLSAYLEILKIASVTNEEQRRLRKSHSPSRKSVVNRDSPTQAVKTDPIKKHARRHSMYQGKKRSKSRTLKSRPSHQRHSMPTMVQMGDMEIKEISKDSLSIEIDEKNSPNDSIKIRRTKSSSSTTPFRIGRKKFESKSIDKSYEESPKSSSRSSKKKTSLKSKIKAKITKSDVIDVDTPNGEAVIRVDNTSFISLPKKDLEKVQIVKNNLWDKHMEDDFDDEILSIWLPKDGELIASNYSEPNIYEINSSTKTNDVEPLSSSTTSSLTNHDWIPKSPSLSREGSTNSIKRKLGEGRLSKYKREDPPINNDNTNFESALSAIDSVLKKFDMLEHQS